MRAFFYDTWAFLALANRRDRHHQVSVEMDRVLEAGGYAAVTSDYVLDEALTGLQVSAGSRVALQFLDLLAARIDARELLLLEMTRARRERAIEIFRKLSPEVPRLSFTDCTSFTLMCELDVRLAFTAGRHFHRAGAGVRPLFEMRADVLVPRWPDES